MSVVTKESNPELYNALFPKDEIKEILEINGDKYNVNLPKEVKEAFICIDYELSVCNCELPKILDYITNLQEERDKFKTRCYKSLKLIRDNYGLLDKYGIDWNFVIGHDSCMKS